MKKFHTYFEICKSNHNSNLTSSSPNQLNRKIFIQKFSLMALILSIPELSAQESEMFKDQKSFTNLSQVEDFLRTKKDILLLADTTGEWKLGKILSHCAQSIEYSLIGFPDNKSKLFQWTLGGTAFMVFSLRGKMSHGLSEPIPGAETLADDTKVEVGITRLTNAIEKFHATKTEDLKSHFAYGNLDKADYDSAHTFHINNHFEELA